MLRLFRSEMNKGGKGGECGDSRFYPLYRLCFSGCEKVAAEKLLKPGLNQQLGTSGIDANFFEHILARMDVLSNGG